MTVNLDIIRPTALGSAHNELDTRIIDAAHETGIPPQILKGQIRQESTFNRTSFRYEPCSWDFATISGGARRIDTDPYRVYAMDGALAIAGLGPTIDFRDQLYVPGIGPPDPAGHIPIRHINSGERGVTAKNIWIASDSRPTGRGENWSTNPCEARTIYRRTHTDAEFLDALDFIAQTPTSSSYGLMQVMWGLVETYHWNVDDPANPGSTTQSPRYLIDTNEAIALPRGGSMLIGSQEDVYRYRREHHSRSGPSTFVTTEDFFDSFKEPLRMYTGGGVPRYGINIVDTYQFDYLPSQAEPIFP